MGKRMDSRIVRESLTRLSKYLPTEFPAMGWYFDNEKPESVIVFEKNKWTCMFQFIEKVANGKQLCFSSQLTG